jgi:hypothetical protein
MRAALHLRRNADGALISHPIEFTCATVQSWSAGERSCDCWRADYFAYVAGEQLPPEESIPCGHNRYFTARITDTKGPVLYSDAGWLH